MSANVALPIAGAPSTPRSGRPSSADPASRPRPAARSRGTATEVKWALAATSVVSTLGGWAAFAQPSPPVASASPLLNAGNGPATAVTKGTTLATASNAAAAGGPSIASTGLPSSGTVVGMTGATSARSARSATSAALAGIAQPPTAASAPRVVTVPAPLPARGRVAAVSRSSR